MKKTEMDVMQQLEKKKYHKNYTPIIIVSIVLTFVLIVSSVWIILANVQPGKLADLAYKVNLNEYALTLYEKEYKKTGDIDSLYMALNLAIKLENDDKVIELFNKFHNNENYDSYIQFVNNENMKLDVKPAIKATLINEDNYLKNCYIQSLLNKNEDQKAFNFALNEGLNTTPQYNSLGNYLYDNFCKQGNIDRFYMNFINNYDNSNILLANIYVYMSAVHDEFYNLGFSSENEVYIWSMGNRVLQVGKNILTISDKADVEVVQIGNSEIDLVESVSQMMDNINKKFKLITSE
jgi:hypothetical protein